MRTRYSAERLRARKMEMRKLCDRMARAFVDRSGNLATLYVRDTDVHIRGGDGGRQRLVSIADDQNQIGFEPLELAGKLHDPKADRFCHGGRGGAFQFDVDLAVHGEAVLFHNLHRLLKAFQDHRSGGKNLELKLRTVCNSLHDRLQAAIVSPVDQNNTYFTA